MSTTEARTTDPRAVARVARKLARERRVEKVRPGWWVFSYGAYGPAGPDAGFDNVTAVTAYDDAGRAMVRLALTDQRGRTVTVEDVRGCPAWCLTAAEARRAGLA